MTGDHHHRFTLDHYKEILIAAINAGYRYSFFGDPPKHEFTLYLRHDVDNSIDSASRLARIEAELGISATYFLLLRSENYNLISHSNLESIEAIRAMGHRIELHFSLNGQFGDAAPDKLPELVLKDAELLSQLINSEIRVFSFHNPTGSEFSKVKVPGLINTYSHAYFKDIKYISESNMHWREKCPCLIFKEKRYPAIQLLIHPMTFCDTLVTDKDVMLYFLYKKLLKLKQFNESENAILSKNPIQFKEVVAYLEGKTS